MSVAALLPGSRIGIMGSGQLGRMLCMVASRMGYSTHVYSPQEQSPAALVANEATVAAYEDSQALETFAASVDVVTFEFENIPFESLQRLEIKVVVRPSPTVLHISQHRSREKHYLKEKGFEVVPFALIRNPGEAKAALEAIGVPSVLKTAGFGYDGKGQYKITDPRQVATLVASSDQEWILEQWQDFEKEISVIVARGTDGKMGDWGAIENRHRNHVLDLSIAPAEVAPAVASKAVSVARAIAESLSVVGLLCVEFFVGRDGSLRVNETAPRPHNSGHWTIEGSMTSQFEQHLRAICGLSLGSTQILCPTAMANLLGDAWEKEPDWKAVLGHPFAKWHSYAKKEPRPGRKMGHLTSVGQTQKQAIERVLAARALVTN